jgi:hypothetical protein
MISTDNTAFIFLGRVGELYFSLIRSPTRQTTLLSFFLDGLVNESVKNKVLKFEKAMAAMLPEPLKIGQQAPGAASSPMVCEDDVCIHPLPRSFPRPQENQMSKHAKFQARFNGLKNHPPCFDDLRILI